MMHQWIILLRGINVGGKRVIRMAELRSSLESQGYQNVRTYIQSGNCILDARTSNSAKLATDIAAVIKTTFGHDVPVFALRKDAFAQAITANPYPVAETDQKTVHLFFLSEPAATADHPRLETLCTPTERYTLTDTILYLHAPDGVGRSKFAAQAEKALGVTVTARNLRSALKILEVSQTD